MDCDVSTLQTCKIPRVPATKLNMFSGLDANGAILDILI